MATLPQSALAFELQLVHLHAGPSAAMVCPAPYGAGTIRWGCVRTRMVYTHAGTMPPVWCAHTQSYGA
jgi:hypothetical protein